MVRLTAVALAGAVVALGADQATAQVGWTVVGDSVTAPVPLLHADVPAPEAAFPPRPGRSLPSALVGPAAVGTGAGLLVGLLLSGASVAGDETTVVVTWTALGLGAGLIAGLVGWLVER